MLAHKHTHKQKHKHPHAHVHDMCCITHQGAKSYTSKRHVTHMCAHTQALEDGCDCICNHANMKSSCHRHVCVSKTYRHDAAWCRVVWCSVVWCEEYKNTNRHDNARAGSWAHLCHHPCHGSHIKKSLWRNWGFQPKKQPPLHASHQPSI